MSDYDPGPCPGCGTQMVNTGAPIFEDLCTNDACTWHAEEFRRGLVASARAHKERERIRDAAPDLLAALKAAVEAHESGSGRWVRTAYDAIAKAEGGA